jgi:hypothetical protein
MSKDIGRELNLPPPGKPDAEWTEDESIGMATACILIAKYL